MFVWLNAKRGEDAVLHLGLPFPCGGAGRTLLLWKEAPVPSLVPAWRLHHFHHLPGSCELLSVTPDIFRSLFVLENMCCVL